MPLAGQEAKQTSSRHLFYSLFGDHVSGLLPPPIQHFPSRALLMDASTWCRGWIVLRDGCCTNRPGGKQDEKPFND